MIQAKSGGALLSAIVNSVPFPDRLTLLPVVKFDPIPVPVPLPPYQAMFNPENWNIEEHMVYNQESPAGSKGGPVRYVKETNRTLSFDLIIDGTGASGEKRSVTLDLLYLKEVIGYNGEEHRNNRVIVVWGTNIFKGVFYEIKINKTLYKTDGTPLRAKVSLKFKEDTSLEKSILNRNMRSADLTREHIVKSGDRLDLLANHMYGDSRFYLEVARANRMTTFRTGLTPGLKLIFPPTEK
ncbi:MAG: hypothetical protein ACK4NS_03075 [Saprospiraceae bacterium]